MEPFPSVLGDIQKIREEGFLYIYKWADFAQHEIKEPYHDQFSLKNKDKAIRQSNNLFLAFLIQAVHTYSHESLLVQSLQIKLFWYSCACPKGPSYLSFRTTKKI